MAVHADYAPPQAPMTGSIRQLRGIATLLRIFVAIEGQARSANCATSRRSCGHPRDLRDVAEPPLAARRSRMDRSRHRELALRDPLYAVSWTASSRVPFESAKSVVRARGTRGGSERCLKLRSTRLVRVPERRRHRRRSDSPIGFHVRWHARIRGEGSCACQSPTSREYRTVGFAGRWQASVPAAQRRVIAETIG